jgi:hypothetical protein
MTKWTTPSGVELDLTTLHLKFKIRASAAGTLMTNDRSGKNMGDTAKNYLEEWIKEQLFERQNLFSSKYTEKGNECEQASIDLLADHYGWGMVTKNCINFQDEWTTGTPDIELAESVDDVKNSWSCFTFPMFGNEKVNKDYYWQGQVYMFLTGKDVFKLHYTLMDAPDHLIEQEARKRAGYGEVEMELYDQVRFEMTYSTLPASARIKTYTIEKSNADITLLRQRVMDAREFIRTQLANL